MEANNNAFFSAVFFNGDFQKDEWYIDSGASIYLTANISSMKNKYIPETTEVVVANEYIIRAKFAVDVEIDTIVNEQRTSIYVKDVLYIPELTTNLLSLTEINENIARVHENIC